MTVRGWGSETRPEMPTPRQTRRRPGWFGLILGVGFLHREFTAHGAVALVLIAC